MHPYYVGVKKLVWGTTPLAVPARTPLPVSVTVQSPIARQQSRASPLVVLSHGDARVHLRGMHKVLGQWSRTSDARNPYKHPAGHPLVIKSVDHYEMSRSQLITNLMNNVHIHRFASVTTSSKSTYNTGWNAWCEFMQILGTDVDASTPPVEWLPQLSTGTTPYLGV